MPQYGPKEWSRNPDALKQRLRMFQINLEDKSCNNYLRRLDEIAQTQDMNFLALSLNDSREEYRLKAFEQLQKSDAKIYSQIANILTDIHRNKNNLTFSWLFPCVAIKQYIVQLPDTAQTCMKCRKPFIEGSDIIWQPCKHHVLCLQCWKELAREKLPSYAVCSCVGFKYF